MIEFSPSRRIAHDCGDFSILAQIVLLKIDRVHLSELLPAKND